MGEQVRRLDEGSSQLITDMTAVLSSLSKSDALRIFERMKDGVDSSTKVIKELGLTQKRYYTRLGELISAGLIDKTESGYRHTPLGQAIYKVLFYGLKDVLANKEKLTLVAQLLNSSSLSMKEKEEVLKTLHMDSKFLTLEEMLDIKRVLKVVLSFDELVEVVAKTIEEAQEEVIFTTRYTTVRVAKEIYDAVKRGVKFRIIDGDKANLSKKMQVMRLIFAGPKAILEFYRAMTDPNFAINFSTEVTYSFFIIDREVGAVEIVDPVTKEFVFAIFFEDVNLCEKLVKVFDNLLSKSTTHPYLEIASKVKKITSHTF